ELTDPLEPTLRALEGAGAAEVELFDPAQGPIAPFLRRLFAEQGAPETAPVALVSCASPAAQAREVAKTCLDLLAAGAAADSIAIAARKLGNGVAEEIGTALDRYGIRWRARLGRPAMASPAVRLGLSMLELLEQDFPREGLIDLL